MSENMKQVRFCNGHAFRLITGVPQILARLDEYNISLEGNERPFVRNLSKIITNYPFSWSFLPKGMPYYIYVTSYMGQKVCLFIERHIREKSKHPRIFALPNFFPSCQSETLIETIIVKTEGTPKWMMYCQQTLLLGGRKMISSFIDRYDSCVKLIDSVSSQTNKTVHLKVMPLFEFPLNHEIIDNFSIKYNFEISKVIMYNMSKERNSWYNPFILKYIPAKDIVLDITSEYEMDIIKNPNLPDVYTLLYRGKKIGITCIRTIEQSHKMTEWNESTQKGRFTFNKIFKKWEPRV